MMMTKRENGKEYGLAERLQICSWNVRSLNGKENDIVNILKEKNIDIALISETKKKLKGSLNIGEYTMIYSGVERTAHATSGVAIILNKKWSNKIHSYKWISNRIITIRCRIDRGYIQFICVYAPEEGKKQETEEFYSSFQKTIDDCNKNDYLLVGGDLNARVGKTAIQGITGTHNEAIINQNGRMLRDFACFNKLKIMNTFFPHKRIHKYTWSARGQNSTIDYLMANDKTSRLFTDVRVYRGLDISSDHFALLGKLKLFKRWVKSKNNILNKRKEQWKAYLLQEESIKLLYGKRLDEQNTKYPICEDIEEEWNNIKTVIEKSAREAIGTSNKKVRTRKLQIWNNEIKEAIVEKKKAYLKYIENRNLINKHEYSKKSNHVRNLTRKAQQDSWDRYITEIEHDVHGRQENSYKIMKHLNRDVKDVANIQVIKADQFLSYYKKLWTNIGNENINNQIEQFTPLEVDSIEYEELEESLKKIKNRKATGTDNIKAEMIKYASENLKRRFLHFLNLCWSRATIPKDWKVSVIYPIFKKGDRASCENYRGISLLNVAYKIYSKIITARIRPIAETMLLEEQNGFRKGRSCNDNIFILKQIIEKHREFNKETHILFVDYKKAFDTVDRYTLFNVLDRKGIPKHLIEVIKNMYDNSEITIKEHEERRETINQGVRQGCSLSPILFDLYIDEALREWILKLKFYSHDMRHKNNILTVLFADDQAIIADSENGLQRAIFELQKVMETYNLSISVSKTKVMAFEGTNPIRSKLIIYNKTIEQVSSFNFLGCNISYMGEIDVKSKIEKFNLMNGTIKRTLGKKVRKETLIKFYKVMSIPTCLYGSENWTLTKKDKMRLQSAEMRFLRSVAGYTLVDRKRNTDIRKELNISSLQNRMEEYMNSWYQHILRMDEDRLPRRILSYNPRGRRNPGRPRKRWIEGVMEGGVTGNSLNT